MKVLPHEILLNLLRKHYSSIDKTSFNDLLISFKVGNSEREKIIATREILITLEKKGYLEWSISYKQKGYEFTAPSDNDADKDTFKKEFIADKEVKIYNLQKLSGLQFNGRLTMEGVEYAMDIDRKKVERKNNRIALWIAAFALILSMFGLIREIIKDGTQRDKVKILKQKLRVSDSSLQETTSLLNQLVEKDSLNNSKLKDTPPLERKPVIINKG